MLGPVMCLSTLKVATNCMVSYISKKTLRDIYAMDEDENFVKVVDICIDAFRVVSENGTPEMKVLARALLFEVGKEAVKRVVKDQPSTRIGKLTKL